MYNRYIPQSDGSYQRNWVPDKDHPKPQRRHQSPQPQVPKQKDSPPPPPTPLPQHRPEPVGNFLKQLLPKNFDTSDLIIVLLLLLLAGDCDEDRNTALLTMVLYLFM